MSIEKLLIERQQYGNPVRVALVGAGYSGAMIAHQVLTGFPGIKLVSICNRTLEKARKAYTNFGEVETSEICSRKELEQAIKEDRYTITDDPIVVCEARGIDAIIESTGTVEHGAEVVLTAVENEKHIILMNAELDATLGPILKVYADRAGVVYSNSDGDEPGVAMNLFRYVKSIGLKPVVAGNLKGLYDAYRTPETQRAFAEKLRQQPEKITSFADGTKLFMELVVLANATGFRVGKRGAYGPRLKDVSECGEFFSDKFNEEGMVDFLVGAAPANGVFVLGYTEDPKKTDYLRYMKMGNGPLYVFYTPFHLPQFEVPLTVAKAVLYKEATVTPMGGPFCDAVTVAKRNLSKGERLDGFGGFDCYSLIENYSVASKEKALPMGVSAGCKLNKNVSKDQLITYDDVEIPQARLMDKLRREQSDCFNK